MITQNSAVLAEKKWLPIRNRPSQPLVNQTTMEQYINAPIAVLD